MSSYVSANIEYDVLQSGEVRVVTRNLDQGSVPPSPSLSYFPTDPDDYRSFLVVEYVGETLGERFVRVATVDDFVNIDAAPMVYFHDDAATFQTDGVSVGDVLEVVISPESDWESDEYPYSSPFPFSVSSVVDETTLIVATPFPEYGVNLNWQMTVGADLISGTGGVTWREDTPADLTTYRTTRYNHRASNALAASNFVTSLKAELRALVNETTLNGLVDEAFTVATGD